MPEAPKTAPLEAESSRARAPRGARPLRLQRLLEPPFADDEQRSLYVRILYTVVTVAATAIFAAMASVSVFRWKRGYDIFLALLAALVPLLLSLWLARRGRLAAAAFLIPANMLLLATVLLQWGDGLQDIAILIYPVMIGAGGLLLGRRSFFALTGLAVVALAWVAHGQATGRVHLPDPEHLRFVYADLLVATILLCVTAALIHLLTRNFRQNLARAVRERSIADALIESLPGAFFLLDSKGRFVRWNSAYPAELGYTSEAMRGVAAVETIAPAHRELVRDRMRSVLREGHAQMEALVLARDGRALPHLITAARVEIEGESHLVGTAYDLSERRRLQEELYRSQKMEAIGSLAGGIAHDFNNLLFAMTALGEAARRSADGQPRTLEKLDELLRTATRAQELVGRVLSFSRREARALETIDLRALAAEVCGLLEASRPPHVRVRLTAAPEPVLVQGQSSELHQVLMNLGTNALHSMEGRSGTLELSVSRAFDDSASPEARISVRDEGHGIPDSIRHRIFDPYFTTKPPGQGTGLGLAMVHGIVANAGGRIEVDSVVAKGTTVHVHLPLACAQSARLGTRS